MAKTFEAMKFDQKRDVLVLPRSFQVLQLSKEFLAVVKLMTVEDRIIWLDHIYTPAIVRA